MSFARSGGRSRLLKRAEVCGRLRRGSAGSEPLRRRVRPCVVSALVPVASAPVASAGRGRERRRPPLRALVGSGGGFVSSRRAQPRIPKSEKKLARVLVGGLLGACRTFRRLLPAISDLFPHGGFRPFGRGAPQAPGRSWETELAGCSITSNPEQGFKFQRVGWAKPSVPIREIGMPGKTRGHGAKTRICPPYASSENDKSRVETESAAARSILPGKRA